MNFSDYLLAVVWLIVGILFVSTFVAYIKGLAWLRDHQQRKWDELGRPSLVKNNSIENSLALFSFLRKGEFRELNDDVLTKRCMSLWLLMRSLFRLLYRGNKFNGPPILPNRLVASLSRKWKNLVLSWGWFFSFLFVAQLLAYQLLYPLLSFLTLEEDLGCL